MRINDTFRELEPAKRLTILNAAMDEFAQHGYEKASTNAIVREAGISKGLLFYYFHSKEELYHDLLAHAYDTLKDSLMLAFDSADGDFIARLRRAAERKLRTYIEHPHIVRFLGAVFLERNSGHLPPAMLENLNNTYTTFRAQLYANIDTSLFRDDVPPEHCIQLIRWCMEGYEKEMEAMMSRHGMPQEPGAYTPLFEAYYGYLDSLKQVFYRK
ncbi:MAG: TetR/AcrR family transcriptional regulator [Clostridia bacterium]|nr:TetR/AcrR family transcriptional regulator [Clostridia bacterium]